MISVTFRKINSHKRWQGQIHQRERNDPLLSYQTAVEPDVPFEYTLSKQLSLSAASLLITLYHLIGPQPSMARTTRHQAEVAAVYNRTIRERGLRPLLDKLQDLQAEYQRGIEEVEFLGYEEDSDNEDNGSTVG